MDLKGMANRTSLGLMEYLALDGRLFIASDADENDRVTGQTSFAITTPTFLLHVPVGVTAIPLFANFAQAGATPAGGDIGFIISIDKVLRWDSGGTSEKVYNPATHSKSELGVSPRPNKCTLYSGATANSSYGQRIFGAQIAPDISPAEGAVQGPYWSPELPYLIEGPGAFMIYTWASTPGPVWDWAIGWAEIPTDFIPRLLS